MSVAVLVRFVINRQGIIQYIRFVIKESYDKK